MNVDIASRLAALRKKHGFSQESLAERLGISRQAVSKWERAEASPDTDNLITLARLYGVSLDDLLNVEKELPPQADAEPVREEDEEKGRRGGVNIGDKDGAVHIGWDGIRITDRQDGTKVDIGWHGVHITDPEVEVNVDGGGFSVKDSDGKYRAKAGGAPVEDHEKAEDYEDWEGWVGTREKNLFQRLPLGIIAVVSFILIGSLTGGWHPAWMVFLLVPVADSLITAVTKRDFHQFAYPVLALGVFLWIGFTSRLWHPGWVIFLTVPVYYAVFPSRRKKRKHLFD